MKVIRASEMGMCFGVRDALASIDAMESSTNVTIHGDLVHNEEILRGLQYRGFAMVTETGRTSLPVTERVVITAHGVSDRERARLSASGKDLIDTTCPLVRRVHEAAQQLQREGYFVVVIGRPGHVEVEGIIGDLDRFAVVADIVDARFFDWPRIGIVCQSTTAPHDARRIMKAISSANPLAEVRHIDTICKPTRDRQVALIDLLERVEALVVVGGRHSNNTRQLARLAESKGLPAIQVGSATDLEPSWFDRFAVVGLTAGTSTLDRTVDEVERALRLLPGATNGTAMLA